MRQQAASRENTNGQNDPDYTFAKGKFRREREKTRRTVSYVREGIGGEEGRPHSQRVQWTRC